MFKTQIWQLIKVHLFFLLTIFSARLFILFYFGDAEKIQQFPVDIFQALFLGLRLDLTVIGYIQSILTILLIFIFIANRGFKLFLNFAKIYLIGIYSIALSLTIADLGFFSFFAFSFSASLILTPHQLFHPNCLHNSAIVIAFLTGFTTSGS